MRWALTTLPKDSRSPCVGATPDRFVGGGCVVVVDSWCRFTPQIFGCMRKKRTKRNVFSLQREIAASNHQAELAVGSHRACEANFRIRSVGQWDMRFKK